MRPTLYFWLLSTLGPSLIACSGDGGGDTDTSTSTPGTTTSGTPSPTTGPAPTTTGTPDDTGSSDASASGTTTTGDTTAGPTSGTTTTGGTTVGADDTSSSSSETSGEPGTTTTTTADTTTGGTTTGTTTDDPSPCVASDPVMPAGDCAAIGVNLQPPYDDDYTCFDLGPLPDVPQEWGGLVVDRDDPNVLLAGGAANTAAGALYAVGIARDASCHIVGYNGAPTTMFGPAEYNDGGLAYHPDDDLLFISRWPSNELGQLVPGSNTTTKVIDLDLFGVVSSPGGVTFVPPGFAGAGQLKMVSWSGGQWYTVGLAPDGNGTYDITGATLDTTIVGGPEAFVYVSNENPEFPVDGLLVAEWSAGNIAAYDMDANATPINATRKDFIDGLNGAESAYIDPLSGDFLFATFSGTERLVVIRGFKPQPQ